MKPVRLIIVSCCIAVIWYMNLSGPQACPECLLDVARDLKPPEGLEEVLRKAQLQYQDNQSGFYHFLSAKNHDGWSPLMHYAAEGNQLAIDAILNAAKTFYHGNPKPIIRLLTDMDGQNRSVLYIAVERNKSDSVKALSEHALAVFCNDKQCFATFINTADEDGWAPLHLAAYNNNKKIVKLLVEAANEAFGKKSEEFERFINHRDYDGVTPLFYAGRPEDIILLTEYGAVT